MGLCDDVRAGAGVIRNAREAVIISHIDADGIASESVLRQAISRTGIPVTSVFLRQLEPLMMHLIPRNGALKIFTDLGAGQQTLLDEHGFTEKEVLIIDHHVSQPGKKEYLQVNCLPYGYNKMSAAGVSYLVAKELDSSNTDLAKIGVIGNVGDMMARESCGLVGPAREIAEDGMRHGSVEIRKKDLNCYGTATRPLHLCLAYSDDPVIPGISNNPEAARQFLIKLGIPARPHPGGDWRVWEDLNPEEKRTIISAIAQQLMAAGEPLDRLFAETYGFPDEPRKTPLRNAQEYATLLNACGRWAKPKVGSAICCGDRGVMYREAEHMLNNHRAILRELLQFILDSGVKEIENLQWVHVGNRYPDTIVGIGAGMALSKLNMEKPILIMCELPEDPLLTKVSMRTTDRIVRKGIDLQQAMLDAAVLCGGAGGGHRIAAGAFVPKAKEQEFIIHVNRRLGEQYAEAGSGNR